MYIGSGIWSYAIMLYIIISSNFEKKYGWFLWKLGKFFWKRCLCHTYTFCEISYHFLCLWLIAIMLIVKEDISSILYLCYQKQKKTKIVLGKYSGGRVGALDYCIAWCAIFTFHGPASGNINLILANISRLISEKTVRINWKHYLKIIYEINIKIQKIFIEWKIELIIL